MSTSGSAHTPTPTPTVPNRQFRNTSITDTTSSDELASAVPDEASAADLPMSMTASMILTHLPKDATQALQEVDAIDDFKVPVKFSALPSAPSMGARKVFKISASQRFEAVVNFLRKKLGVKEHEALFCYINSVFAPGLDEGVGNLYRSFKIDDQLYVSYSMTPAFG